MQSVISPFGKSAAKSAGGWVSVTSADIDMFGGTAVTTVIGAIQGFAVDVDGFTGMGNRALEWIEATFAKAFATCIFIAVGVDTTNEDVTFAAALGFIEGAIGYGAI